MNRFLLAALLLAPLPTLAQSPDQSATDMLGDMLTDPISAQYTFLPQAHGGVEDKTGWFVCGVLNAKDGRGKYAGETMFIVSFGDDRDGPAIGAAIDDIGQTTVARWCANLYSKVSQ